MGVIRERDEFDFLYKATLPEMTDTARMWIPLPTSDRFQTIEVESIKTPGRWKILKEQDNGNTVLFLMLSTEDSGKTVELRYHVQRLEKNIYREPLPDPGRYLGPERLVPLNENFRSIAAEVVKDKKSDIVRARALYDHVIDEMRYMKHGSGWGKGDAVYACDVRTGNCTDFHSYFIALARSVGIPARFAIGAAIPSERNDGGIDGYHCWAEFYADDQPDPGESILDVLERQETAEHVQWALSKLPVKDREILALKYLEELKTAELAQQLNVPVGTAKARIHRALAKLKAFLEKNHDG